MSTIQIISLVAQSIALVAIVVNSIFTIQNAKRDARRRSTLLHLKKELETITVSDGKEVPMKYDLLDRMRLAKEIDDCLAYDGRRVKKGDKKE